MYFRHVDTTATVRWLYHSIGISSVTFLSVSVRKTPEWTCGSIYKPTVVCYSAESQWSMKVPNLNGSHHKSCFCFYESFFSWLHTVFGLILWGVWLCLLPWAYRPSDHSCLSIRKLYQVSFGKPYTLTDQLKQGVLSSIRKSCDIWTRVGKINSMCLLLV